jgi:hypothetical protein
MTAKSQGSLQLIDPTGVQAAWEEVWHLWKLIIPRRSITGRLVHGQVWRRHDGRRWIYKKFVDCALERDE